MTNSLRPVTTQWKFSILSVCNTDLVPPLLNLRERGREGGREKKERGKRRNRWKEIKEKMKETNKVKNYSIIIFIQ